MAPSRISIVFFLLLTTAILTTAIPPPEYNSLVSALRSRNYDFFADAISTTEIHSDILSGRNLTVFVPIDASPFPSDYINTVRYHIVADYRLTASDIRKLPYGPNPFPTLAGGRKIYVTNNGVGLPVSVNGVRMTVPDVYHDKNVVVHGIKETVVFYRRVDRAKMRWHSATDVDIKPPAWPSDSSSSQVLVTPEEARALAKYLAVAGFETAASLRSEVVAPQTRVESISDPLEEHRSELVTNKLHGSERHLGELNIKEIHDVSRSETRGDDAEEVFDEFGTGMSELISENQLAAKYSGEGFSHNKMIDSATAVEDGEQYSRIDEIRLGDPHRPELCTPASMACAN